MTRAHDQSAIPLAEACLLRAAVMMVCPGVSPVHPRQWHHPNLEHHNPGQPRLLRTTCSLGGKGYCVGQPTTVVNQYCERTAC
jgi:hypothetical protein